MSIRPDALRWLSSRYDVSGGAVYASKFFKPEKSWTKRSAWWLEIPMRRIQASNPADIHLLCQVAPDTEAFYYLRVPAAYFREQLPRLSVVGSNKVSLFLSAEPESMFVDQRGNGKVHFGRYLVT